MLSILQTHFRSLNVPLPSSGSCDDNGAELGSSGSWVSSDIPHPEWSILALSVDCRCHLESYWQCFLPPIWQVEWEALHLRSDPRVTLRSGVSGSQQRHTWRHTSFQFNPTFPASCKWGLDCSAQNVTSIYLHFSLQVKFLLMIEGSSSKLNIFHF